MTKFFLQTIYFVGFQDSDALTADQIEELKQLEQVEAELIFNTDSGEGYIRVKVFIYVGCHNRIMNIDGKYIFVIPYFDAPLLESISNSICEYFNNVVNNGNSDNEYMLFEEFLKKFFYLD